MGHLILYASALVVGALALRPKLSLAITTTLPVGLAIAESRAPAGLPDWLLLCGIIATAYCLAAVIVAFFLRRSGDVGGDFGALPLGREARYSRADKLGLWYTFALLCIATGGSALVGVDPPHGSIAVRAVAILLVPAFGGLAVAFWKLLRDRDIVIRIHDDELEILSGGDSSSQRVAWQQIAGYTFWFGIFRVYDKSGRRLLRVDNTIDGFVALLYHVNRKTFRAA